MWKWPLSCVASSVTIPNVNLASSSETWVVNLGIRRWKNNHLIELVVRKALVESITQKSEELIFYNLV
jgi:hypothetical protein